MSTLTIHLLGPPLIKREGQLVRFDTRKAVALAAYLTMADHPVSRHVLAGLFWSKADEKNARNALRRTLNSLAAGIGKKWILANRNTIELVRRPELDCDVWRFRALLNQFRSEPVRNTEREKQLAQLTEAVNLYRGRFLEGFTLNDSVPFDQWQTWNTNRLSQEISSAFALLLDCLENLMAWDAAVLNGRRWVELDPLNETAHRELMRFLALTDRRSAALQQYETCVSLLQEELGIKPEPQTTALHYTIIRGELDSAWNGQSKPPAVKFNLPSALTSFVGREKEIGDIDRLLKNSFQRLVTIIGPGGSGKTRLAVEAAHRMKNGFSHGIVFVPLESVSDSDALVGTLADTLDISFSAHPVSAKDQWAQLLERLGSKEMLLILDSFEHLVDESEWVYKILQTAPNISLLVTSQEKLNLLGEWAIEIGGLEISSEDDPNDDDLCQGVDLFVQRVRQVNPDFELTREDKRCIRRICRLVEGLPLGIELAATWIRILSCREIAEQMEEHLDFLETPLSNLPPRQRSMRAAFEYSFALMSPFEKRLISSLSVFRRGFRAEAALAVGGASLADLLNLVNKSLLRRIRGDRFELNSILRLYAGEKFRTELTQPEKTEIYARHGRYYAGFLKQHADSLRDANQTRILTEISEEIANIRQSWRWAVGGFDFKILNQLLDPLYRYYETRSWFQEGINRFSRVIVMLGDRNPTEKRFLGRLLVRQGRLLLRLSFIDDGEAALVRGLELLDQPEDLAEKISAFGILGIVSAKKGDLVAARRWQEEAFKLAQQCNDRWGIATGLRRLGEIALVEGKYAEAEVNLEESLKRHRQINNPRGIAACLNNLGWVLEARGRYEEAIFHFDQSLAIKRDLKDRRGMAVSLSSLSAVWCGIRKLEQAEKAVKQGFDLFDEIGDRKGLTSTLVIRGRISLERGNYEQAARLFEQGLKTARAARFTLGAAWSLLGLGETAREMGHVNKAREAFLLGIQKSLEARAIPFVLDILLAFGQLLQQENADEAAAVLFKAVSRHPACRHLTRETADRLRGVPECPSLEPASAY